jgi:hypothetical protein
MLKAGCAVLSRPAPLPGKSPLMRKRGLRVDLFRVGGPGVSGFPALGAEAPEKAGPLAQFAGPARRPHFQEQLVAPAGQAHLHHVLKVPRGLEALTILPHRAMGAP